MKSVALTKINSGATSSRLYIAVLARLDAIGDYAVEVKRSLHITHGLRVPVLRRLAVAPVAPFAGVVDEPLPCANGGATAHTEVGR